MDVYSRIRKRIKPETRQKITAEMTMLTMIEEKTYTKEEVQHLLAQLINQIDFYNQENIQLKKYIRVNWIPFGKKDQFLKDIREQEDQSDTLIFNLLKQWG